MSYYRRKTRELFEPNYSFVVLITYTTNTNQKLMLMKKSKLLLTGLLFTAILGSCDKDMREKDNFGASAQNDAIALNAIVPGSPVSDDGTVPYIIPGENRGGNRTCDDVAAAFNTSFDYSGVKLDYNGSFSGMFPDGLEVTVTDGKFVEFEMTDCILIGDKYYKVGAVIVKGSNDSNVYYYPGGTLGDSGLAAPVNASGSPAGLSNLSFCFVECVQEPKIIALKSYMTRSWAVTGGGPDNNYFIGCLPFVDGAEYTLYLNGQLATPAGTLEIGNFDQDQLKEVRITSTISGSYFTDSYLYVGPAGTCTTDYSNYPYHKIPPASSSTVIFDLPF